MGGLEEKLQITYIYGQQSATIEGLPLIDPSLVYNAKETPTFGKIELDKKGIIKNVESLSSNEYQALRGKIVKESQELKFGNSVSIK